MSSAITINTRPLAITHDAQPQAATRLLFIDNIRVLLTVLVVLHHLMITYTGTGSWYYEEGTPDIVSAAFGAWFLAVNQSYFMGLFLLIAAYFVPGAYERKGAARFIKDRMVRLGIPLLLYCWVLRPVLIYVDEVTRKGWSISFGDFYTREYFSHGSLIGGGPLWFIETLLIFSLVYALWRLIVKPHIQPAVQTAFPERGAIIVFSLLLGLASYVVRLQWPVGWSFGPLNLQFPFFPQYIALFVAGVIAYQRQWFVTLPDRTGRNWMAAAIILTVCFWPMMIGGGALSGNIDPFMGGRQWQALAYALWESALCVSMCIGLIWAFRKFRNHQGALAQALAHNAYTTYLIHGPVIVAVALAVQYVTLFPLLKFAVVALVALPLSFALSALLRKLPYADRVL
jgi:glucan biosynthesis protein C